MASGHIGWTELPERPFLSAGRDDGADLVESAFMFEGLLADTSISLTIIRQRIGYEG